MQTLQELRKDKTKLEMWFTDEIQKFKQKYPDIIVQNLAVQDIIERNSFGNCHQTILYTCIDIRIR